MNPKEYFLASSLYIELKEKKIWVSSEIFQETLTISGVSPCGIKRWLTCTLFWWSAGSPRHWRSPRHKTSLWVQEKTFPFGGERRAAGRREAVSVLTCGRHHTKSIASDTLIIRWRLTNPAVLSVSHLQPCVCLLPSYCAAVFKHASVLLSLTSLISHVLHSVLSVTVSTLCG